MMPHPVSIHGSSHLGLTHAVNEDAWSVLETEEDGLLLVVCDGMGGMGRGDEASALAVAEIERVLAKGAGFPPERMQRALRTADASIRVRMCSPQAQPGATAVMVYLIEGVAYVAWVGDSRAYLIRDGRVVERTRDHKLVRRMVEQGNVTEEQAADSDLSHVLTRCLGGRQAHQEPVVIDHLPAPWGLRTGDRILLCSDGASDLIHDDEFVAFSGEEPEAMVERLIALALERGGHDNITCLVGRWDGQDYREDPAPTPVITPGRASRPPAPIRLGNFEIHDPSELDDGRVTEEIPNPGDITKLTAVGVDAVAWSLFDRRLTPWLISLALLAAGIMAVSLARAALAP
jgi:PPM family protein phosphatase